MARVFLCEDSHAFRVLTRLQLDDRGHEVVGESGNIEDCAEAIRVATPDVVLIDGMFSGLESWSPIRRHAPNAKLILYSGMPPSHIEKDAKRVGADAWITKSAPVDELAALIMRLADC